jgi:hypothetical protein
MIDTDKLAAARAALGMPALEKEAGGLTSALKALGLGALVGGTGAVGYGLGQRSTPRAEPPPSAAPVPDAAPSAFTPQEQLQFERHGLDPGRLKFIRALSSLRQGMNLDRKLFEQALAGKLPAGVLGGGGDEEEDVEAYA